MVLDAAHEKSTESSSGPKREEIMESILFKCSDFVVVQFKDMDSSYARRGEFWFPKYASWFIRLFKQTLYIDHMDFFKKKEIWAF